MHGILRSVMPVRADIERSPSLWGQFESQLRASEYPALSAAALNVVVSPKSAALPKRFPRGKPMTPKHIHS